MLYDNKLRLRRVQGTFGQDFLSEILSHLLNMPPIGLGDGKDRDRWTLTSANTMQVSNKQFYDQNRN